MGKYTTDMPSIEALKLEAKKGYTDYTTTQDTVSSQRKLAMELGTDAYELYKGGIDKKVKNLMALKDADEKAIFTKQDDLGFMDQFFATPAKRLKIADDLNLEGTDYTKESLEALLGTEDEWEYMKKQYGIGKAVTKTYEGIDKVTGAAITEGGESPTSRASLLAVGQTIYDVLQAETPKDQQEALLIGTAKTVLGHYSPSAATAWAIYDMMKGNK